MLNPFATTYTPSATSQKPSHNQPQKRVKNKKKKNTVKQTPAFDDSFNKEAKFITIEAAIDPIQKHTVDTHQSIEHGYERYIEWINKSLRVYDTVTLVGMNNAIVDVISIVTILQNRKIGIYDDVETFSMDSMDKTNRLICCIQVKLHPY
ncbi:hypothetical protein BDB01DRAFT_851353 [Pilobolus umbonatus]|nr:hypothetical protein BDB01DRAFT_851353 [Pilobolus umbonatus]